MDVLFLRLAAHRRETLTDRDYFAARWTRCGRRARSRLRPPDGPRGDAGGPPARDATGALRFVLLASLDLAKALNLDDQRVPGGRMVILDDKGTVLAVFSGGDADLAKGASVVGTQLAVRLGLARGRHRRALRMPDGRLHILGPRRHHGAGCGGRAYPAGAPMTRCWPQPTAASCASWLMLLVAGCSSRSSGASVNAPSAARSHA